MTSGFKGTPKYPPTIWSEAEIEYLKRNSRKKTVKELSIKVNHTFNETYRKLKSLQLPMKSTLNGIYTLKSNKRDKVLEDIGYLEEKQETIPVNLAKMKLCENLLIVQSTAFQVEYLTLLQKGKETQSLIPELIKVTQTLLEILPQNHFKQYLSEFMSTF